MNRLRVWTVSSASWLLVVSWQAESELQRATMDATRTTRQLEETIDLFERQKIRDIKVTEIAQFSVSRLKELHHYKLYSEIPNWELGLFLLWSKTNIKLTHTGQALFKTETNTFFSCSRGELELDLNIFYQALIVMWTPSLLVKICLRWILSMIFFFFFWGFYSSSGV